MRLWMIDSAPFNAHGKAADPDRLETAPVCSHIVLLYHDLIHMAHLRLCLIVFITLRVHDCILGDDFLLARVLFYPEEGLVSTEIP
jgi:hypothetical protein